MIRLARLQIYGLYSSMFTPNISEFPSFSLERLLSTCFGSSQNKLKVCTLVDLPDLSLFDNYQFIDNQRFQVQSYGKKYFFDSLTPDLLDKLNYASVDFLLSRPRAEATLTLMMKFVTQMEIVCLSIPTFVPTTTLYLPSPTTP